ncbi:hypothetical protein S40288_08274 [Stachybotrys chartarum IBT 40288]|nr:hypothetical protein S40288_08274 [Stachybotrys chartarum IBT 40288]
MVVNAPANSQSPSPSRRHSMPHTPPPSIFLQPDSAVVARQGRPRASTGCNSSTSQSPHGRPQRAVTPSRLNKTDIKNDSNDHEYGSDGADDEMSEPGSDILYGNYEIAEDSTTYETSPNLDVSKRSSHIGMAENELLFLGSEFEAISNPSNDEHNDETDDVHALSSGEANEHRLIRDTPTVAYKSAEETASSDIVYGWAVGETRSFRSSASHRSARPNELEVSLMKARSENKKTGEFFFPRKVFTTIITRRCVEQKLCETWPQPEDTTIGDYNDFIADSVDRICQQRRPIKSRREKVKGLRRIFTILVLLKRTEEVLNFLYAGIDDSHLPLVMVKRDGETALHDLRRRGDVNDPIDFITTGWDEMEIDSFYTWQWKMLSPCFAQRKAHKKVWHYKLQKRVQLPYIGPKATLERYFGGFSQVSRVYIHEDHHDFHDRKGFTGSFALKKLSSASRDDFDREVDILKKFSNDHHPHLISLLVTYEQHDTYYLLFDWAECNLNEYWSKKHPDPDPCDRETVLWVAEQCKGIAEGILKLHRYTSIGRDSGTKQSEPIFGHHGDIKEANILWFPEPSNQKTNPNSGVLKLADFGVAGFNSHNTISITGNPRSMATPSYRAPESDLDSPSAQGRSYDIWTLAILYLQFSTWLLGGWSLLERFKEARLSIDPGYCNFKTDTFFESAATTESRPFGERRYRIKPIVTREEMLIVKTADPEPRDRIEAGQLYGKLKTMVERCQTDSAYALVPKPDTDR